MSGKPRVLARRAAQVLTASTVVAGGLVFVANPAYAAPPAVSSVVVVGSTSKVVTAGTTVLITGTGFSGMTDNAADAGCNITPVAYPGVGSGCSQVRFLGVGNNATSGYTLSEQYSVVSDTQMYVTVPTIAANDGATAGAPVAGTGSVRVQVVNTNGGGTSSLGSTTTGTGPEVFYRHPLTASLVSTDVTANPNGGGVIAVNVTGVAPLTGTGTTATFPMEKITAYFTNSVNATAPRVYSTSVTFRDATSVNVVVPPGSPAGNDVAVMLLHDGIAGTADADDLVYPAVITKLETCAGTFDPTSTTTLGATLPVCTGAASVPAVGGAGVFVHVKVTGKGLTGATAWDFDGATAADVTETCLVVSDFIAYCKNEILVAPTEGVVAVTFDPADPAGGYTDPGTASATTGGSIFVYSSVV